MESGQWTNIKPDGKEPCVFVSATKWGNRWDYSVWVIKEVGGFDGYYLGICDGDGDEWGDLEDLRADLYMILPKHEQ